MHFRLSFANQPASGAGVAGNARVRLMAGRGFVKHLKRVLGELGGWGACKGKPSCQSACLWGRQMTGKIVLIVLRGCWIVNDVAGDVTRDMTGGLAVVVGGVGGGVVVGAV